MRVSRRTLFTGAAVSLAAAVWPTLVEPRWLTVNRYHVPLPGQWARPLRIAHLSDFHVSAVIPWSLIDESIDLAIASQPDFVCLTGDFITNQWSIDERRYVAALRRLAGKLPTFAVLGNHDGGPWALRHHGFGDHSLMEDILDRAGVALLHNRNVRLTVRNRLLQLAGVGDYWSREVAPEDAFRGIDPQVPTVVMAHNPDSKDELADRPWHLMLSGHTHGGQIVLPGITPNRTPVKDKRFIDGLRQWESRWVHVNRGVGNVYGVRLNCRPELSVLELG